MKLKITNKTENKLLKRTELTFEIDHTGEATPTRIDMRNAIAAKQGCAPELIVLNKFKTVFGKGNSKGLAHQYKNAKDLESMEPKYIIKRYAEKPVEKKEAAEEETPAEQPEEVKSEEKPVEEVPTEDQKETTDDKKDSNNAEQSEVKEEKSE